MSRKRSNQLSYAPITVTATGTAKKLLLLPAGSPAKRAAIIETSPSNYKKVLEFLP
jgi:hypothetical protein